MWLIIFIAIVVVVVFLNKSDDQTNIDALNDGTKCVCKTHPGKCDYCHNRIFWET